MHCNESLWLSAPLSKLKAGTFLNLNTVVCDLSCCSLGQPSSHSLTWSQSRRHTAHVAARAESSDQTPRPAISTRPAPAPAPRACAHGRSDEINEPGGGWTGKQGLKRVKFQTTSNAVAQAPRPQRPTYRHTVQALVPVAEKNGAGEQIVQDSRELILRLTNRCKWLKVAPGPVGILAYSVIV